MLGNCPQGLPPRFFVFWGCGSGTMPAAANLIRSRATTRFYSVRKRLNPRRRCSLRVLTGFPFAHSRNHVPWRIAVAKWNITQDPAPSTTPINRTKRLYSQGNLWVCPHLAIEWIRRKARSVLRTPPTSSCPRHPPHGMESRHQDGCPGVRNVPLLPLGCQFCPPSTGRQYVHGRLGRAQVPQTGS